MKIPLLTALAATLLVSLAAAPSALARGEGGGHMGGGERMEGDREGRDDSIQRDDNNVTFEGRDGNSGNVDVNREGDGNTDVDFGYDGKSGSAQVDREGDGQTTINATGFDGKSSSADINHYGDGVTTVSGTGPDGRSYDAAVVGPDGFRSGYIWRGGAYVPVDIQPLVNYEVPFGTFAGWNIVNQPTFIEYPCYATYPVETAVQVQLTSLGFYEGPIDGLLTSVAAAISSYQQANNLEVTGTISPSLLDALSIDVSQD